MKKLIKKLAVANPIDPLLGVRNLTKEFLAFDILKTGI